MITTKAAITTATTKITTAKAHTAVASVASLMPTGGAGTANKIATNVVTWFQTHKWHAAIGAVLVTPAVAILQAGFFLAQYRLNYRDAPAPIVPVHGVVVVSPWDDDPDEAEDEREEEEGGYNYGGVLEESEDWVNSSSRAGAASRTSSFSSSSPSNNDGSSSSFITKQKRLFSRSSSLLQPIGRKGKPGGWKRRDSYAIDRIHAGALYAPLRLLVIGDSVAAGVGVSESCAPVFPEVLAKTLSRAMGGRAVYWTCVGEAGASAAWVLRELEAQKKGADGVAVNDDDENISNEEEDNNNAEENGGVVHGNLNGNKEVKRSSSSFINGGGADEYSFKDEEDERDYEEWCERLANHQNKFNPDDYGQYDIAVVITGPNELKNGFLPFMVNGEDAELYRQAQQKRQRRHINGGDLHLVIDALVTKMILRFKDSMDRMRLSMETRLDNVKDSMGRVRTSMEPVFDNVRGSMHNFRERIASQNNRLSSTSKRSSFAMNVVDPVVDVDAEKQLMRPLATEESSLLSEYDVSDVENESMAETSSIQQQQEQSSFGEVSEPKVEIAVPEVPQRPHHPLIILPGMPLRLLPMFRWLPLRWLAYILINAMEKIKRALSKAFPGTVIFAEAPGQEDITAFAQQRGKLWEMRESTEKNVLLSLKSIPLEVCQKVENEMKEFSLRIPAQRHCCGKGRNIFEKLISSDMVHPSDLGYDFFGRHVANAILEEWDIESNEYK